MESAPLPHDDQIEATAPTSAAPQTKSKASAEAALAARRSERDQRRAEAAKWVPNRSTPFQECDLHLLSDQAQHVFHLSLVHAQRSLYHFYHTLPANNDALNAAETIIEQKFEDIEERMKKELGRLTAVANEIAADPVTGYSNPRTFKVKMYTQEAARFGRLLQMYDEIVQWADALMFAGNMKRTYRSNILQESRNMMVRFSRQIHLLYMQSRGSVRRQVKDREIAKIKKAMHEHGHDGEVVAPKDTAAAATDATDATASSVDSAPEAESKAPVKKATTKKASTKTAAAKKTAEVAEAAEADA